MPLFKKKPDPISERANALKAEIAALETQIQQLSSKTTSVHGNVRLRSTALPNGTSAASAVSNSTTLREPIFEPVDHNRVADSVAARASADAAALGVAQPGLTSMWDRVKGQFRSQPVSNPKLVSYLAAGSIKGLRPLRYEKRIARNRFLALTVLLVVLLWGIYAAFVRNY
jgi:hypothetical protein